MMMFVLLQSYAPSNQRLKGAINEFNRPINTETLLMWAGVLLASIVCIYAIKRAYQTWSMRKRKKLND